jgi:hypothetical protein
LPQRGCTNHVSTVDAGARAFHVFAGLAGRNGDRQRGVGSVGDKSWCPDYNALCRSGVDSGINYSPALPVNRKRIGADAGGGAGLISMGKTTF